MSYSSEVSSTPDMDTTPLPDHLWGAFTAHGATLAVSLTAVAALMLVIRFGGVGLLITPTPTRVRCAWLAIRIRLTFPRYATRSRWGTRTRPLRITSCRGGEGVVTLTINPTNLPRTAHTAIDADTANLAKAWGVAVVTCHFTDRKALVIRAHLHRPTPSPTASPASPTEVILGADDHRDPVTIDLLDGGLAIEGPAGNTGTSGLVCALLAQLATDPAATAVVFDGKTDNPQYGEYVGLADQVTGNDLDVAAHALRQLVEERVRRTGVIGHELGVHDLRQHRAAPQWPVLAVVIDSATTFTVRNVGRDKPTRDRNTLVAGMVDALVDLLERGPQVGIAVIFTAAEPLPKRLRALLAHTVTVAHPAYHPAHPPLTRTTRSRAPRPGAALLTTTGTPAQHFWHTTTITRATKTSPAPTGLPAVTP